MPDVWRTSCWRARGRAIQSDCRGTEEPVGYRGTGTRLAIVGYRGTGTVPRNRYGCTGGWLYRGRTEEPVPGWLVPRNRYQVGNQGRGTGTRLAVPAEPGTGRQAAMVPANREMVNLVPVLPPSPGRDGSGQPRNGQPGSGSPVGMGSGSPVRRNGQPGSGSPMGSGSPVRRNGQPGSGSPPGAAYLPSFRLSVSRRRASASARPADRTSTARGHPVAPNAARPPKARDPSLPRQPHRSVAIGAMAERQISRRRRLRSRFSGVMVGR